MAPNLDALREQLSCPVCMEYMKAPINQCSRGHLICGTCFQSLSQSQCPQCRIKMSRERNYAAEKLAEGLHMSCCFQTNGCQYYDWYFEVDLHQKLCDFKPNPCKYASNGCKETFVGNSLAVHIKECVYRPVGGCIYSQCGCRQQLLFYMKSAHEAVCDYALVECPNAKNGCTDYISNKVKKDHLSICLFNDKACQNFDKGCTFKASHLVLKSHENNCLFREVACSNMARGCTVVKSRSTIEAHIQNCPFNLVSCQFKNNGCPRVLNKYVMTEHEQDCQFALKACVYASWGCCEMLNGPEELKRHIGICKFLPVACKQRHMGCTVELPRFLLQKKHEKHCVFGNPRRHEFKMFQHGKVRKLIEYINNLREDNISEVVKFQWKRQSPSDIPLYMLCQAFVDYVFKSILTKANTADKLSSLIWFVKEEVLHDEPLIREKLKEYISSTALRLIRGACPINIFEESQKPDEMISLSRLLMMLFTMDIFKGEDMMTVLESLFGTEDNLQYMRAACLIMKTVSPKLLGTAVDSMERSYCYRVYKFYSALQNTLSSNMEAIPLEFISSLRTVLEFHEEELMILAERHQFAQE